MGKATGIIASVSLSLGGMIAGHFMADSKADQTLAPYSITSLDDLQRVREQSNKQVINPATGKPDATGTVQAWVEQQDHLQQDHPTSTPSH